MPRRHTQRLFKFGKQCGAHACTKLPRCLQYVGKVENHWLSPLVPKLGLHIRITWRASERDFQAPSQNYWVRISGGKGLEISIKKQNKTKILAKYCCCTLWFGDRWFHSDSHWCAGKLALLNTEPKQHTQHKQQTLTCSACRFPWCKYSLHGWLGATNVPSLKAELERNAHSWLILGSQQALGT